MVAEGPMFLLSVFFFLSVNSFLSYPSSLQEYFGLCDCVKINCDSYLLLLEFIGQRYLWGIFGLTLVVLAL